MADKCAGCFNKYKYFERPSICPECRRSFCQTCLPYQGRKVKKTQPQIATEQCVYCSKQRSVNKSEEEDILSNFQERFYKHAHTEPPIQSRVRLDLIMGKASDNSRSQSDPKVVQLSEEDKVLEERLRKLKESHKKTTPCYSEEELKDKLEHLRGDSNNKGFGVGGGKNDYGSKGEGGGGNSGGGKTQTEESDELMEKTTDEVMLDNRLRDRNDVTEEDLRRRLQALKDGESSSSSVGDKEQASHNKFDIKTFLDDIDDPFLLDDSPEMLLNDLIAFQLKESKNALAEVDSTDVQFMLEKARELAKQEGASNLEESEGRSYDPLPHIVYPLLPDGEGDKKKKTANSPEDEAEIAKAICEGLKEVQMEHEEKSKDMDYIKQTSEQLARIRAEEREKVISDDEVVRSKPKPKPDSLDFSWGHFSPHSTPSLSQDQSGVVGRVLPNSVREEFNDEVQDLIARTLEEAELDKRLEASGLKYQTENTPIQNKMNDNSDSASGRGAATSFTPNQMAVPRIVDGTDDLPWCCICNDDATIHCYDCDDDLYCQRCFSEGHKQFGLFDHQYEMFDPPRK